MKPCHARFAAVAFGVFFALLSGRVLADDAPAELSPSSIAQDQAASLCVRSDGGHALAPPPVAGLRYQRTGQSTEMTSINGAVTTHTWTTYAVMATRPGHYTIPIGAAHLELEVSAAGAPAPSAAQARLEPSSPNQVRLAFLRVVLGKRKVYVGEAVPVTFKAYFRPGTEVTLEGAPSLGASAFTISPLPDEPRQSVETIGDQPYRVAAWSGTVSAAMAGHFSSVSTLPVMVRYREAAPAAADPLRVVLRRRWLVPRRVGAALDDAALAVRRRFR